jgi:hypothetical protein
MTRRKRRTAPGLVQIVHVSYRAHNTQITRYSLTWKRGVIDLIRRRIGIGLLNKAQCIYGTANDHREEADRVTIMRSRL